MSVDTIWKACAFGDADLLRDFLHRSPELVDRPDDQVRPSTCSAPRSSKHHLSCPSCSKPPILAIAATSARPVVKASLWPSLWVLISSQSAGSSKLCPQNGACCAGLLPAAVGSPEQ